VEGLITDTDATYLVCPACFRAVARQTGERFCMNDGTPLLAACPQCGQPVTSPYARFCHRCGAAYAARARDRREG